MTHPLRTRLLSVAAAALLVVPLMAGAQPALASELTALTSDKVVHAAAFAGLAFFLWIAFGRRVTTVFLLAVAIGALHEASQVLLPGREPGLADLMADAVGAAAALLLLEMLTKNRGRTLFPASRNAAFLDAGKRVRPLTQGG